MWFEIFKEHIDRWEGLRLKAYQDVAGVWTIGYGHTGPEVHPGMVITQEEADEFLREDTQEALSAVERYVTHPMTPEQKAVFTSLAFNIGVGGFRKSTALKRFNAGDIVGAAEAITWWNKARDPRTNQLRVVQGLVNRREAERELFLRGVVEVVEDEVVEAPENLPSKEISGGEHKSLLNSNTMRGAAVAASSGGTLLASLRSLDPLVAIAALALIGALAFLAFNRYKEWKKGEH